VEGGGSGEVLPRGKHGQPHPACPARGASSGSSCNLPVSLSSCVDPHPADLHASGTTHRKTSRRWNPGRGVHYVTFSCYRRLPLLGVSAIRDVFVDALARARKRHGFKLLAWVVMPEHVHLMLVPTADKGGGSPLSSILIAIKKPVASAALNRWKKLRWSGLASITDSKGRARFWQSGGGFDRNVRDLSELGREVVYIHQNPVERGLAARSTGWAWSSARWYAGWEDQPAQPDSMVIDGVEFPGSLRRKYLGDSD